MARIINEKPAKRISEARRALMLRAMDDQSDLAGVMHIFHHYTHCDSFLLFLIESGYTGKVLRDFVIKEFSGNVPNMIDWIVLVLNHKKTLAKVNAVRSALTENGITESLKAEKNEGK